MRATLKPVLLIVTKTFFKSIAISIGVGLAVAIGSKLGHRSTRQRDTNVDLAPVEDRVNSIEYRVGRIETSSRVKSAAESVPEDLETRLATRLEEMVFVRDDIRSIESRSAEQIAMLHQKLTHIETRVPVIVAATVEERIIALERKLQAEFREMQDRAIEMFVHTIDTKIVSRISRLEQNMLEHSDAISTLRQKSMKTDENLQRLLTTVDRLCNRFPAQTAMADTRSVTPELVSAQRTFAEEQPEEPIIATFGSHLTRQLEHEHVVCSISSDLDTVIPDPPDTWREQPMSSKNGFHR
jgi:signal transduction histidine kinase